MYDDIVAIAKRENNSKRNFLIVNKLQGKHFPTSPKIAFDMFDCLYEKIKYDYEFENILVIGFCETATAIGLRIAKNLDCKYIQTTREYDEKTEYIYFSEEHSHATEQKLAFSDINSIYDKIDRIIFVDDEISTGKTILNIICEIKKSFHNENMKFTAISIINGMDNSNIEIFNRNDIDIKYLLKIDNSKNDEHIDKLVFDGKYYENMVFDTKYNEFSFKCGLNPSQNVIFPYEYQKCCESIYEDIIKNIDFESFNDILVIGTEEFMYMPMYIGEMIEKTNKNVKFHSTTRSPICVSYCKNYPLNERYSLCSIYDDMRQTYIYNLKKYDCVLVITNSSIDGNGTKNIVSALKNSGNDNIYIIRCN